MFKPWSPKSKENHLPPLSEGWLATGLFINIHKMASPVFCGIFGSVIWLLAQSGAKLNGIIPKPLPVFSESFTTIT